MDAEIRMLGDANGELAALAEWLQGEDELRGRVRVIHRAISQTELGSVVELLMVALGSGGMGTVLASSMKTWLTTRRPTAKIIVKSANRSVTLDIQNADDVAPLLEQILRAGDDS